MFTTAFDASGNESDTPCLVVAGFLGTADAWTEFEPEWTRRLGPLGYWSSAHMAKTRPDILRSLVDMIPRFGFRKFSCAIDIRTLRALPDEIRRHFRLHAYPVCGRTLATCVDLWAMQQGLDRS